MFYESDRERTVFVSQDRHLMTLRSLRECEWINRLAGDDEVSEEMAKNCVVLQKYIIKLAESFGCEIPNKQAVLESIDSDLEYHLD